MQLPAQLKARLKMRMKMIMSWLLKSPANVIVTVVLWRLWRQRTRRDNVTCHSISHGVSSLVACLKVIITHHDITYRQYVTLRYARMALYVWRTVNWRSAFNDGWSRTLLAENVQNIFIFIRPTSWQNNSTWRQIGNRNWMIVQSCQCRL